MVSKRLFCALVIAFVGCGPSYLTIEETRSGKRYYSSNPIQLYSAPYKDKEGNTWDWDASVYCVAMIDEGDSTFTLFLSLHYGVPLRLEELELDFGAPDAEAQTFRAAPRNIDREQATFTRYYVGKAITYHYYRTLALAEEIPEEVLQSLLSSRSIQYRVRTSERSFSGSIQDEEMEKLKGFCSEYFRLAKLSASR